MLLCDKNTNEPTLYYDGDSCGKHPLHYNAGIHPTYPCWNMTLGRFIVGSLDK